MLDAIVNFFTADIRTATPILIAAIGILYSERAGIVNIGVEGLMLIGALMGVYGSYLSGSVTVGLIFAVIFSMLFALIFGIFTIYLGADQTVVGMALNIFALGFTTTLNRIIFGVNTSVPKISTYKVFKVPVLNKIPIIGEILFENSIIVYFAIIIVFITVFIFKKTNYGLKIKAVGENPKAADTLGINVYKIRMSTVLISGALAGIAGSYVSMGQLSFFTENMVAGRGYMALAAVVFGNYRAKGVLLAVLIFGAGDAIVYRLQAMNFNIPYQFLVMLPYIITIVALCAFAKHSNKPASSAIAYKKG